MTDNSWKQKCPEAYHDDNNICGFFGPYRFLSNFEPSPITYDGISYLSVEGAYHAQKTLDISIRKQFSNLNPSQSKALGRKIVLRPDWEDVKVIIMTELVTNKFQSYPHLKELLLNTGNKYLEETNWWGDTCWGVCKGQGLNYLGKILSIIRSELIKQKQNN